MLHGSALDERGIFSLERIREFFEKMKIPIDEIKIEGGVLNFEGANQQTITAFYNLVRERKLCPAATIYDYANKLYHVVTIDSPLPNQKYYYQAKNTSKNDKKMIISHYSNDINCAQILDAIIIRFYLDSSHPFCAKNKN